MRPAHLLFAVGILFFGVPSKGIAQQVLVDDPESVPVGAGQLEAWHSGTSSQIVPALRVHPVLEVAAGADFRSVSGRAQRMTAYSLEGKVLFRPGSTHQMGIAAVGGVESKQLTVPQGRPASVFASGVFSQDLAQGRLTAYQNVGWLQNEDGPHQITWGMRLDWSVGERLALIGEVAGEGSSGPSAQAALRTVLLPQHVEMDLSVTQSGLGASPNTTVTVGLTLMTSPLY